MGHERVGFLPKTQRWQSIVNAIGTINYDSKEAVSDLANKTLYNVKSRFDNIYIDDGVKAAFAFLTSLATYHLPKNRELTTPDINLKEPPSPVQGVFVRSQDIPNTAVSTPLTSSLVFSVDVNCPL